MELRNYTRWREARPAPDRVLVADLLGTPVRVLAHVGKGKVQLGDDEMSPDYARLIGVRLIEAAAIADGDRAIRSMPEPTREDH